MEITKSDLVNIVLPIKRNSGPSMANKCTQDIARVFNWTEGLGLIIFSPAHRITYVGGTEQIRDRVLNVQEIKSVWEALADYSGYHGANAALQIMLLTGVRPGEARHLNTSNIEFYDNEHQGNLNLWGDNLRFKVGIKGGKWGPNPDYALAWLQHKDPMWWTIPPELTKTGEPHKVPITDMCMEVLLPWLMKVDKPWLFNRGGKPVRSYMPVTKWVVQQTGITDFYPYAIRHTVADHLAQMGVDLETIKLVLGHKVEGSIRNYVQHRYDPKRLDVIRKWHHKLRGILGMEQETRILEGTFSQ